MAPGGRWTLMPFHLLGAGAQCAEARVWALHSVLPPWAPVALPCLPCVPPMLTLCPPALFFLGSCTTRVTGMPLASRAHQRYGNSPDHTSDSDPRSPCGCPAPSHALWRF